LEEAAGTEDWEITPEPVSTWTQIEGKNVSSRIEMLSESFEICVTISIVLFVILILTASVA
jgi:hypothetical protein